MQCQVKSDLAFSSSVSLNKPHNLAWSRLCFTIIFRFCSLLIKSTESLPLWLSVEKTQLKKLVAYLASPYVAHLPVMTKYPFLPSHSNFLPPSLGVVLRRTGTLWRLKLPYIFMCLILVNLKLTLFLKSPKSCGTSSLPLHSFTQQTLFECSWHLVSKKRKKKGTNDIKIPSWS